MVGVRAAEFGQLALALPQGDLQAIELRTQVTAELVVLARARGERGERLPMPAAHPGVEEVEQAHGPWRLAAAGTSDSPPAQWRSSPPVAAAAPAA